MISILLLWLRTNHIIITKKDSRIKKTTGKLKDIEGDKKDVGVKSQCNVMVGFVLYYTFLIDAQCIHINPKQY